MSPTLRGRPGSDAGCRSRPLIRRVLLSGAVRYAAFQQRSSRHWSSSQFASISTCRSDRGAQPDRCSHCTGRSPPDHLIIKLLDRTAGNQHNTGVDELRVQWQKTMPTRRLNFSAERHTARSSTVRSGPKHVPRWSPSIARGRRWLDELITDPAASPESVAEPEQCTVRHVNMTVSLAFVVTRDHQGCHRAAVAAWNRCYAIARRASRVESAVTRR